MVWKNEVLHIFENTTVDHILNKNLGFFPVKNKAFEQGRSKNVARNREVNHLHTKNEMEKSKSLEVGRLDREHL